MKKLSKIFVCATLLLFALGIVACGDLKNDNKVSAEEWNAAFEKIANKGVVPASSEVLNSLKEGEEVGEEGEEAPASPTDTPDNLTMTNGGVIITQKVQIIGYDDTIESRTEACPEWDIHFTNNLKGKMIVTEVDEHGEPTDGIMIRGGFTAIKKHGDDYYCIEFDLDEEEDAADTNTKIVNKQWEKNNNGAEYTTTYSQLGTLFNKLKTFGNEKLDKFYKNGSYEIKFAYESKENPFVLETEDNYDDLIAAAEEAAAEAAAEEDDYEPISILGDIKITFNSDKDVKKLIVNIPGSKIIKFDLSIAYADAGAKSTYKFMPISE